MVLSRQNANNMISVFIIFIQEDFFVVPLWCWKKCTVLQKPSFLFQKIWQKETPNGRIFTFDQILPFSSSFFSLLLAFCWLKSNKKLFPCPTVLTTQTFLSTFYPSKPREFRHKKITAVAALLHNWFTLNLWESSFLSKKLEINLIYHYKTSN